MGSRPELGEPRQARLQCLSVCVRTRTGGRVDGARPQHSLACAWTRTGCGPYHAGLKEGAFPCSFTPKMPCVFQINKELFKVKKIKINKQFEKLKMGSVDKSSLGMSSSLSECFIWNPAIPLVIQAPAKAHTGAGVLAGYSTALGC